MVSRIPSLPYSTLSTQLLDESHKIEAAFKIEWKCLIGIGPVVPGLGASDATFVHDTNFSFVLLAQPHCTFFFVLFLLDKPHLPSDRIRYTDADAEALAASIIDHPITESVKFSYLWNNRTRSDLISLEEGILDCWYHGRIVLAGDAVHKVRVAELSIWRISCTT